MRRIRYTIGFLLVAVAISALQYFKGNSEPVKTQVVTPTPTLRVSKRTPLKTSLFVPYWSLGQVLPTEYDRLIYFGITPTTDGIDTNEVGYQGLSSFVTSSPKQSKKLLTLRMLTSSTNFSILKNTPSQKKIITETLSIAKKNNFDGVVLDLELQALPFESLLKQINGFTKLFYTEAQKSQMSFAITQYGDTFYRVRPFDVPTIAQNADEVMIMAYDFHKAGGNPGPNFPLDGRDAYGYDFKQMTDGFLKVIPPEKLTIIFGYFGYDWPTDKDGKAINRGAPFSYNQITQQYLNGCESCVITRDDTSSETRITYTSGDNIPHIVWFEDAESIARKEAYLKSKGITSYSYWAHSYF